MSQNVVGGQTVGRTIPGEHRSRQRVRSPRQGNSFVTSANEASNRLPRFRPNLSRGSIMPAAEVKRGYACHEDHNQSEGRR